LIDIDILIGILINQRLNIIYMVNEMNLRFSNSSKLSTTDCELIDREL